jgi:hypothetical protein
VSSEGVEQRDDVGQDVAGVVGEGALPDVEPVEAGRGAGVGREHDARTGRPMRR